MQTMSIPLFLLPIFIGLVAQGLKPIVDLQFRRQEAGHDRNLPRYGGMPSAHTAFAFSLATVIAAVDGLASTSFAIAAAVLIFILDDALRMRIFLGRHGKAIRQLISELPPEKRKGYPHLEKELGHKVPEVVAGSILGCGLTLVTLYFLGIS